MDEDNEDGRGHMGSLVQGLLFFSNRRIFPLDQPALRVSRLETMGEYNSSP